jgi:hypothetical protein
MLLRLGGHTALQAVGVTSVQERDDGDIPVREHGGEHDLDDRHSLV